MSAVTLSKAATDPRLLGSTLELWPRQVELLRTLEGAERTVLIAAARQVGKTTLAAMLAVHNATMRPDLDRVLPRRRKRFILVAAPGEDQSREFIDVAAGLIADSPALRGMAEVSASRIEFRLPDGRRSCIVALPANAKTVRGRSASLVILEEFAHFDQSAGPGSDERLYRALRPSMRRFGSLAKLVAISTPSGESGRFWELHRDAEQGVLPSATAVRLSAWEVDPSYGEEQREADRAELGEDGFAEECGAEFVTGSGSFFDLSGVRFEGRPAAPEEGTGWVCGLDAAFSSDLFGIACVGRSRSDPNQLVVGAVAALKPKRSRKASEESFEDERARQDSILAQVAEIVAPYSPRGVADLHKGGPVKSYLGRQGVAVKLITPSDPLTKQRSVSLRARLEDGSLRAWAHAQLIQDLRRIRATDADRIHLPKQRNGSHCDAAVALSLAVWELKESSDGRLLVPEGRIPEQASIPGPSHTPLGQTMPSRPPSRPLGVPDWQWKRTQRIRGR